MKCDFYVPIVDVDGEETGTRLCPRPATIRQTFEDGTHVLCCSGHRSCAEAFADDDNKVVSVELLKKKLEHGSLEGQHQ
jgi:hypothetical protein